MKQKTYKYLLLLLILAIILITYFITPNTFQRYGFSIKYSRLAQIEQNQISNNPIESSGEVIIKRRNYQIKITYIHNVTEINPIEITNNIITQIESAGKIYNKTEIKQIKYNDYQFYTTSMTFNDGAEEAYIKYAIHYDPARSNNDLDNQVLEEALESFKIN